MEPVGVGRRAVAVIIDSLLLFVVGYVIASLTQRTTDSGFDLQGWPFFLWLLLGLGYYIVMEKTSGATLGKMAMKLKVVKAGGEPLDWQASVVRNVLRLVDGLFFYLVGAITVWISKGRQRLGDMAAHTIVTRVHTWLPLVLVTAFAGLVAADALAAPPSYSQLVISDEKDGPPKGTFKPTTPKIFLQGKVVDAAPGTKVKADWIAARTEVAPPNYKIDSTELTLSKGMDRVTFSFSKPTKGWPIGDYRVELFIDGKPVKQVPFRVKK